MKVKELIAQLQKCDPDATVVMFASQQSQPRQVEWVRDVKAHRPNVNPTNMVELRGL